MNDHSGVTSTNQSTCPFDIYCQAIYSSFAAIEAAEEAVRNHPVPENGFSDSIKCPAEGAS